MYSHYEFVNGNLINSGYDTIFRTIRLLYGGLSMLGLNNRERIYENDEYWKNATRRNQPRYHYPGAALQGYVNDAGTTKQVMKTSLWFTDAGFVRLTDADAITVVIMKEPQEIATRTKKGKFRLPVTGGT